MPSFGRQLGRGKAVGPDSSAAAGAASGGPGAPGASGAVSDSPQSGRKRKRGEASLFAYDKLAVRDVPCLMCVKSALKSKSLRIILRNDLARAGVEDDDQPREDNEDDKELASFTKIGREVFEVITEVDAIRKMRTRRAALEQLGLAAADEGDDDGGLDNWPSRDTQRYPSW
ncbi:hypothetical protein VTG60DRAFT_2982 [Thermothelomyces hinnuleus]